jgi:hypothetical protein
LNAPKMARTHGVALEAEEATTASAGRYTPSIPTCLASRKQFWFTNAPSRHGRIRKCEGMSKAAMKAKRSNAEAPAQFFKRLRFQ